MEKQAYNLLRKEGFKNENDLLDMTTFKEADMEAVKERMEVEKRVDYDNLSEREVKTLEIIEEFIKELRDAYIEIFHKVVKEFKDKGNEPTELMKKYLEDVKNIYDDGIDLPRFGIYNREFAKDFLDDCGLDYEMGPSSFLVMFQLPKVMAKKHYDHSYDSGREEFFIEDIYENRTVGIGDLYRATMRVVWAVYGYYTNEKGIYMDRINALGEHDEDKYYYLWESEYFESL